TSSDRTTVNELLAYAYTQASEWEKAANLLRQTIDSSDKGADGYTINTLLQLRLWAHQFKEAEDEATAELARLDNLLGQHYCRSKHSWFKTCSHARSILNRKSNVLCMRSTFREA